MSLVDFDLFQKTPDTDFAPTLKIEKYDESLNQTDPVALYKESDYILVREHANFVSYNLYHADHSKFGLNLVGSVDIEENRKDPKQFIYSVTINTAYDEETDSDMTKLGEFTDHNEALKTLWENRYSAWVH